MTKLHFVALTTSLKTFVRTLSFCVSLELATGYAAGQTTTASGSPQGSIMSREQIIAEGEKMADAQLTQLAGKKPDTEWVGGVMWSGYADFSHVSSKRGYQDALAQLGEAVHWTPLLRSKSPNHADDLAICQAFLDAYVTTGDPTRIAPTQSREDSVCAAIQKEGATGNPGPQGIPLTWWWCDALFMAPPALARLSAVTKDPKYVDAMDQEWWRTAGLLYDEDEHLFFRDETFLNKRTQNGKKVFWSRGNGWVFAGIARMLTYLPKDYPSRPRYVTVFKDMAAKLASLQQTDGTWRPSLLDPDQFPDSETSGTALDCYAYAWGISNGLLNRGTYLPVATKAWAALLASRRPDGLPGYVQGVGKAPGVVKADGTQLYATGAFLMAVGELSKLAPLTIPPAPQHRNSN